MFEQPVKPQASLVKPEGLCKSLALVTSSHKSPFPGDLSLPALSSRLSHCRQVRDEQCGVAGAQQCLEQDGLGPSKDPSPAL